MKRSSRRVRRIDKKPRARKQVRGSLVRGGRPAALLRDVRQTIASARERVARQVNEELVALYWAVGTRVRKDLLKARRADYGQEIVSALGRELSTEFGDGFSASNLWHMVRFSEVFPDENILYALRRELSWTHFRRLIYIEDAL